MTKPGILITNTNLVIKFQGKRPIILTKNHEKYDKIISTIKEENYDSLDRILNPGKFIEVYTDGIFYLAEDNNLYLKDDNEPVHSAIAKKIVEFYKQELPYKPLIEFWKNLRKNPSKASINQLYTFLEKNNHPITDDGRFIAYKKVDNISPERDALFLVDNYTKKINNNIGAIVAVLRSDVDDDPEKTCSHGLHVASYEYAQGYSGNVLIEVAVNPKDVVAVPVDYDNQKMRVAEYQVLAVCEQEYKETYVPINNTNETYEEQELIKPDDINLDGIIRFFGDTIDLSKMNGWQLRDFLDIAMYTDMKEWTNLGKTLDEKRETILDIFRKIDDVEVEDATIYLYCDELEDEDDEIIEEDEDEITEDDEDLDREEILGEDETEEDERCPNCDVKIQPLDSYCWNCGAYIGSNG